MSSPSPRRERLERKVCPDCRLVYFNDGHHAEVCTGPAPALGPEPCGRIVSRTAGITRRCWAPKGHGGPCR